MSQPHVPDERPASVQRLLDLDAVNAKLRGKRGPAYWRSLEEIAETPEFQAWVDDEFPNRRDLAGLHRRDFLKFMGASLALAGVAGCRGVFLPDEKLVPYVKQPEEMTIGKPLYYATAVPIRGYAMGVLVEQREGRPIKLEGNPDHPISKGALDAQTQAQILNFYDPDRLATVLNVGNISTVEQFAQEARKALVPQQAKGGAGLRILTETVTSPSLAAQINDLLKVYPQARWHVYDSVDTESHRVASEVAFGAHYDVQYNLAQAEVIVALDSDFLQGRPDSVLLARQFAEGRRNFAAKGSMSRLYSVESSMSITGASADHRWPVRPSEVAGFASALAAAIGVPVTAGATSVPAAAVQAIAKDLQAKPGAGVVIAGDSVSPDVVVLAHAINAKLAAIGNAVTYTQPADYRPARREDYSLGALTDALNQGLVDSLIIVGGNPVYNAPADLKFGDALAQHAKFKVHLTECENETGQVCDWSLPLAHPLEAWGDLRASDGTVSLAQPLIAPLHGDEVLSAQEFFSLLAGGRQAGYDLLRAYYTKGPIKLDHEAFRRALHNGVIPGTASKPVHLPPPNVAALGQIMPKPAADTEVKFALCPKVVDGRFSNNGWLRELPHPITKVTWDNVIEISPQMALRMKISSGNILQIASGDARVSGPAWVQPGQPDGSVTLTLGYGRTNGGAVATTTEADAQGYDAFALRTSTGMGSLGGATITNLGGDYRFANVQMHHAMQGRNIVRTTTLAEFKTAGPEAALKFPTEEEHTWKTNTMYPDEIFPWAGEQWAMTIDLNLCTGCNACVTACQAENNIPVVGKDQVARGREMHWIRLDRYYGPNERRDEAETASDLTNPSVVYQPVMCLQCEKAPCEPVCPVAATVHSHDGLNQMVYNRCVGTRYCSDNCPYKVRRFNFLNYTDNQTQFAEAEKIPLLRLLNNPDVTVRGRGVMEKCTYCVQRISDARIEAKKANLPIPDGGIVTACQQACPSQAIIFGNMADKKSAVSKSLTDPRAYMLLEDLNTRPRTQHLARLRNPNPEITV
ncbi:MAG: TAT-variant-translocated molybdopterin oxidoreductase [Fimbriimonadaceae bacterium]